MNNRTALVLGATGGIGGAIARRLATAGWHVRALHRAPDRVRHMAPYEWVEGDAMIAADTSRAASDAELIVHAVNPPGYRDWERRVLPMLDGTIAAARTTGARIFLPGTVYNYGSDALPDLFEGSPQNAPTKKGRIRVEMERRLEAAAARGETRVLIVRAGDFFGPRAGNNWFSQAMIRPGGRPKAITYPGRPGVGHQWAFLPDVAESMVRLLETVSLNDFARFHMEGQWDADGTRMVAAIQRALGAPRVAVRPMPWRLMGMAAPFVPLFRELVEMRYLWEQPVRLRNDRLLDALGAEPRTDLDEAVGQTLAAMGCLAPRQAGTTLRTP